MTLRVRVMEALQEARRPMTSRQIAHIIGEPLPRITSPVSRLCAYGFIKQVGQRRTGNMIENVWQIKEAAYR